MYNKFFNYGGNMKLINLTFSLLFLFISSLAYADIGGIIQVQGKNIALYAEPTANAKTVANVTVGQQLIPVYQQKDWVKVANPANGEIGWVKQNDLQQTTPALSHQAVMQNYVITQQNGTDKKVFQIDAKGDVQALKDEQAETVIKQMTEQQQQMQEQFNKMMSNARQNYLITQEIFNKFNQQMGMQMPTMMPSIIVINKADSNANKPATGTQPVANKTTNNFTPNQSKQ